MKTPNPKLSSKALRTLALKQALAQETAAQQVSRKPAKAFTPGAHLTAQSVFTPTGP